MARLSTTEPAPADAGQAEARSMIQRHWGSVPNLGAVLALSLPTTRALLEFDQAMAAGSFGGGLGERIAIAVSHENRCSYCLAAHTVAASAHRVPAEDIADARTAGAADPKTAAALRFAQRVVRQRGHVDTEDVAAVREAGWSDADIVEIVGHVVSTTLTNYLHHISEVPVDYPAVEFADADVVA